MFEMIITGCDFNNNGNSVKIISIDTDDEIIFGVPQLFNINIEYTLSTDEFGYVWVGFNSDNRNPNSFPTTKSYEINKGSGRILFTEMVTPIDWSKQDDSFSVMVILSAHNNGNLGDTDVDRKTIQ